MSNHGTAFLVGAGPGDPELLTVKAHRCLSRAEVLIYDRLVHRDIIDLAPEACLKIYAGKRKHLHAMSQEQINHTLIKHARAGKCVVRLKGGDPFVFGRGGEEAKALEAAGIAWVAIPGITAAIGAAAAAGIALTHRDYAQAVTLITAHRRHGQLEVDWALALRPAQTVVFYMAGSLAGELARALLVRGCAGSKYLSVISHACQPQQKVHTTTLADFAISATTVTAPAVLILHDTPPVSPSEAIAPAVSAGYAQC